MDKLLLIDGNSITYRAFYGTYRPDKPILKNSKGTPLNAVLTFTRTIEKAIQTYNPTHVLVAFDAGKKTVRHEKLESYKAGRKKAPDELFVQFPIIKRMLELMDIKHYEIKGIEADDIIGTLATQHSKDSEVVVLSSDKDMYQLVNEQTKIIVPQNGYVPDKIIDFETFEEKLGYLPNQVPDIKGLVGDASDNLPGVKGIGPKGAVKLISKYQTLEEVYKNIDEIKGTVKDKLIKDKDISLLCKEIATIFTDIDVPFSFKELESSDIVSAELIEFLKEHELNSLVKRFQVRLEEQKPLLDNFIL